MNDLITPIADPVPPDSAGARNNLGNMPRYFIFWREDEFDNMLRASGFDVVAGWTDSPARAPRT